MHALHMSTQKNTSNSMWFLSFGAHSVSMRIVQSYGYKWLFGKRHGRGKNTRSKGRSQCSLFLRSKKLSNMLSYFFLKETPWASFSLRIQNRQMFQNKMASVEALHHQLQSFHKHTQPPAQSYTFVSIMRAGDQQLSDRKDSSRSLWP